MNGSTCSRKLFSFDQYGFQLCLSLTADPFQRHPQHLLVGRIMHSTNEARTRVQHSRLYSDSARSNFVTMVTKLFLSLLILIETTVTSFKQILKHEDDEALLRTYINVWSKFLDQSNYLPHPFSSMEINTPSQKPCPAAPNRTTTTGNSNVSSNNSSVGTLQKRTADSHVRKLMLDTWSKSIFSEIKYRLQNSAMKIIYSERIGEPFDSQLVIGVRESYGKALPNCYTT